MAQFRKWDDFFQAKQYNSLIQDICQNFQATLLVHRLSKWLEEDNFVQALSKILATNYHEDLMNYLISNHQDILSKVDLAAIIGI